MTIIGPEGEGKVSMGEVVLAVLKSGPFWAAIFIGLVLGFVGSVWWFVLEIADSVAQGLAKTNQAT